MFYYIKIVLQQKIKSRRRAPEIEDPTANGKGKGMEGKTIESDPSSDPLLDIFRLFRQPVVKNAACR